MVDPAPYASPLRGLHFDEFSYVVIKRKGAFELTLPESTAEYYQDEEVWPSSR